MKTVEFRDGERDVPDHVALLLEGIETYQLTYQQAIDVSNQRLVKARLADAQKSLIAEHLKRYG